MARVERAAGAPSDRMLVTVEPLSRVGRPETGAWGPARPSVADLERRRVALLRGLLLAAALPAGLALGSVVQLLWWPLARLAGVL